MSVTALLLLVVACHLWFALNACGSQHTLIQSGFADGYGEHGICNVGYSPPLTWLLLLGVHFPILFPVTRWRSVSLLESGFFSIFSDLGPLHPFPFFFHGLGPCFLWSSWCLFCFGGFLLGKVLVLGTSLMEDMAFWDLVDYSKDSLDGIFTTMGELAPVGNSFLGWELEQHLGSSVPPQVDNVSAHMPVGNPLNSFLKDGVGLSTSGDPIPVELAPKSSTIRCREVDQNRQNPSFSRGLHIDILSWLPKLSNPPPCLVHLALDPVSNFLSSPLAPPLDFLLHHLSVQLLGLKT